MGSGKRRAGPRSGQVRRGRRQSKAGWVEGWLKHANQRARAASSLTLSASGCVGGVGPGRICGAVHTLQIFRAGELTGMGGRCHRCLPQSILNGRNVHQGRVDSRPPTDQAIWYQLWRRSIYFLHDTFHPTATCSEPSRPSAEYEAALGALLLVRRVCLAQRRSVVYSVRRGAQEEPLGLPTAAASPAAAQGFIESASLLTMPQETSRFARHDRTTRSREKHQASDTRGVWPCHAQLPRQNCSGGSGTKKGIVRQTQKPALPCSTHGQRSCNTWPLCPHPSKA